MTIIYLINHSTVLDDNRISRACLSAFSAQVTFYRNIGIFLFKHHVMRTHLDTCQTTGTRVWIYEKGAIIKMNGILRAVVGTYAALVTEVDPVIARSGKTALNTQQ